MEVVRRHGRRVLLSRSVLFRVWVMVMMVVMVRKRGQAELGCLLRRLLLLVVLVLLLLLVLLLIVLLMMLR